MTDLVQFTKDNGMPSSPSNPPVRFESRRPRRHFRSAGSDAQDDSVKAVVLIGGGRTLSPARN